MQNVQGQFDPPGTILFQYDTQSFFRCECLFAACLLRTAPISDPPSTAICFTLSSPLFHHCWLLPCSLSHCLERVADALTLLNITSLPQQHRRTSGLQSSIHSCSPSKQGNEADLSKTRVTQPLPPGGPWLGTLRQAAHLCFWQECQKRTYLTMEHSRYLIN